MSYDIKINKDGTKRYYVNNILHREEGPAVEFADGIKHWYKNGKLHRDNEPAVEYTNGDKEWYKNGQRHREDGPAIEFNKIKRWYLNNNCYGCDYDFTNDSWKTFVKTLIFS